MPLLPALASFLHPWLFMARALAFLPPTLLRLCRRRQWAVLFHPARLRQAWFAAFWRWAGPQVRAGGEAVVVPLLAGRVARGRVGDKADRRKRMGGGVIVEVGPGSGMWVSVLAGAGGESKLRDKKEKREKRDKEKREKRSKREGPSRRSKRSSSVSSVSSSVVSRRSSSSTISTSPPTPSSPSSTTSSSPTSPTIYGIEPNTALHDPLRARAAAAGLAHAYHILPLPLDALAAGQGPLPPASADAVVCLLCLCGIPNQAANCRALYALLKPGGRLYVYEHVRATRGMFIRGYQWLINLFWPALIGGCHLCRDTEAALRAAGPWSAVDLAQPVTEPWYFTMPHIVGILTK